MISRNVRFALCCWNYWGDLRVDRPDNTDEMVVTSIVNAITDATKQPVYNFQKPERSAGVIDFVAERGAERREAYNSLRFVDPTLFVGELDYIFCRWRWDVGLKDDQRIKQQDDMLKRFLGTRTRILIWDEDFQLAPETLQWLLKHDNVTIVETSESAREREYANSDRFVYAPHPIRFDIRDAHDALKKVLPPAASGHGDHLDETLLAAYVGNNYEREEHIDSLLGPFANEHPGAVHMYGNWLKYDRGVADRHKNIVFHPKVGRQMRDWVYQHSSCVPMLAKSVYFKKGHITPRLHEVVSAGGIPVGFSSFKNASRYFAVTAESGQHFSLVADWLSSLDFTERVRIAKDQCDMLIEERLFDVDLFFKNIGVG